MKIYLQWVPKTNSPNCYTIHEVNVPKEAGIEDVHAILGAKLACAGARLTDPPTITIGQPTESLTRRLNEDWFQNLFSLKYLEAGKLAEGIAYVVDPSVDAELVERRIRRGLLERELIARLR